MDERVYDKMFERESSFWWHLGMKKFLKVMLDRYLPNLTNNLILDAGCGTGGFFDILNSYGQVHGVEANPKAVAYAQKRKLAAVVCANIEKLPFAGGRFDVVVCHDVLYHQLVDEQLALKEFYRVLRPGGILLIKEPAFSWLYSSHDRLVWAKHRYTRKELSKKLVNNKFHILKASYLIFFLFPLALARRLIDRLFTSPIFPEKLFYSPLSFMLKYFLYWEAWLLKYFNFPFGLSVICLAKK